MSTQVTKFICPILILSIQTLDGVGATFQGRTPDTVEHSVLSGALPTGFELRAEKHKMFKNDFLERGKNGAEEFVANCS